MGLHCAQIVQVTARSSGVDLIWSQAHAPCSRKTAWAPCAAPRERGRRRWLRRVISGKPWLSPRRRTSVTV